MHDRYLETPLFQNQSPVLLIVDSDIGFADNLARQINLPNTEVALCPNITSAFAFLENEAHNSQRPIYAVIDVRLNNNGTTENGLRVLQVLNENYPNSRAVILSHYLNYPVTVAAIKCGANDCLTKASDAETILAALETEKGFRSALPEDKLYTAADIKRDHVRAIVETCGGNISQAARKMHMHRRTLQRILRNGDAGTELKLGAKSAKQRARYSEAEYVEALVQHDGQTTQTAQFLGMTRPNFIDALRSFGINPIKAQEDPVYLESLVAELPAASITPQPAVTLPAFSPLARLAAE